MIIRKAKERGQASLGWLDSYHTFSFSDYYDARWMGFHALRVINDDIIMPERGFGTHPHRNMEIVTYVLSGALEHKDSMGNGRIIRAGEMQYMSAGTGVHHSEWNPSGDEAVHLLQIWIEPDEAGLTPAYAEWRPTDTDEEKTLVVSPDGRDGSLAIHQDARIYRVRLMPGKTVTHELSPGRAAWLQVASGELRLDGVALETGDGASTEKPGLLTMRGVHRAEALLFDLNTQ